MKEYEYSMKVKSVESFIEYCKANNYAEKVSKQNRIVFENKAYLLPHTGSGLLVLDMYSCRIEYLMGWRKELKLFLDTICCSDVWGEKNEIIGAGSAIYKFIEQSI